MTGETRPRSNNRRTRDLAAIHVCAKKLGMDRDTYEAMLERVTGLRSAGQLDARGRAAVLRELRRLGAPRAYPGRPHNFASRGMPEMITKVEAQLADMGLSWAYADAIAQRMFGIARVAWLRQEKQLRALIAALHVEQGKRQVLASVEGLMQRLDVREAVLPNLVAGFHAGWRRDRRILARLHEALDALAQQRGAS